MRFDDHEGPEAGHVRWRARLEDEIEHAVDAFAAA